MTLEFIKEQLNVGIKSQKNHFGIKNFSTGAFDFMQEALQIMYMILLLSKSRILKRKSNSHRIFFTKLSISYYNIDRRMVAECFFNIKK